MSFDLSVFDARRWLTGLGTAVELRPRTRHATLGRVLFAMIVLANYLVIASGRDYTVAVVRQGTMLGMGLWTLYWVALARLVARRSRAPLQGM